MNWMNNNRNDDHYQFCNFASGICSSLITDVVVGMVPKLWDLPSFSDLCCSFRNKIFSPYVSGSRKDYKFYEYHRQKYNYK